MGQPHCHVTTRPRGNKSGSPPPHTNFTDNPRPSPNAMPLFKLKRAGARAMFATFPSLPHWRDLASEISSLFGIPQEHVRVAYLNRDKEPVTFNDDAMLQNYVQSLRSPYPAIKLVVDDVRSPDLSIPGTWFFKSNMPSVTETIPLKLFGWVLDKSSNPFSVTIAKSETIDDLKDAIKKKIGLDGLASDLVVWRVFIPADRDLAEEVRTLSLNDKELLGAMDLLSEAFPNLPQKGLHFVVAAPPTDRKRKREDPVDISAKLYHKWNVPLPKIPTIIDLRTYLDAPLDPEEKIPISDFQWRMLLHLNSRFNDFYTAEDLEVLFIKSEDEMANFFFNVHMAITRAPPLGTENSFLPFWDRNILDLLTMCLDNFMWIRNSDHDTNTGSFRPDLGLLFQRTCLFRGEEKRPPYGGKHPRQELIDKTRWAYGTAPYVLGYYAIGADVTLAAIGHQRGQVVVEDILAGNLSTVKGRIKNAARMIRLVKVLRALEGTISKDVDADMLPLIRDDGKSIEFLEKTIRKFYPIEKQPRISFLKSIYDQLKRKRVPNVDFLKKIKTTEDGYFLELGPRDVKNAVICVLKALQVLHTEPQVFHRDIRWPNVIQDITDRKRWFLIDWEDAAMLPTKAAPNLHPQTHAPQVFEDDHGAEVDIWGVGELIATAGIDLDENIESLGQRMVEGSISSAEQALVKSRIRSVSRFFIQPSI
ncbi:uncharacterized protein EI90DRAFT_3155212 [Cantharellus anzutake]|uniref:uncharacterized protein n=1 Tax=Cantharellus anzutake TaxID=1750568 RepID=UPI001908742E|nr:uncharacterized protein EI90DRAFT_3155212 [Cantharellus anzutake]KAF8329796.1 hypothetical protein EI90DRAFT_3155212 [Cantharellus anzutake]